MMILSAAKSQEQDFAIDKAMCLETLRKIQQSDFSSFNEIEDIEAHIAALKNEIIR